MSNLTPEYRKKKKRGMKKKQIWSIGVIKSRVFSTLVVSRSDMAVYPNPGVKSTETGDPNQKK